MPNLLIHETSPYLLQHANNPVNWCAWNDETMAKAKAENKMLLISVGYAACHWCHVMEHESFEDREVAKIMNENYICIKVDREERPDVDQVYMDAAYLINGSGGWPLNALAMPDGKPFFAGTYFPKENWVRLLQYFADIYNNERNKLEEQAENVSKGIREIEKIPMNSADVYFSQNDLDKTFVILQKSIDKEKGGTKGAMKFPMPSLWAFLLQQYYYSKNVEVIKSVEVTLQNMAFGGIYDQVGGGFSRYATDPNWHVPHFEKMLYDNAQLVSLYSQAFAVTHHPLYKNVVYETLAFCNRELLSPEGGFYASLDADSEGEEGKYYVWTKEEIQNILKEDAELYTAYYGISASGNWEHQKNIPDRNFSEIATSPEFSNDETIQHRLDELNKKLLIEREKRIRPATDDKILTAWNSLMAMSFIDAYRSFGEENFLRSAKRNLDFLLKNVCNEDHSLFRNFKNGKSTIPAFLDDYAFLISALIAYYQVTFEEAYLFKAKNMTHYVEQHFYDGASGMFFYTNDLHSNLIARKMETSDNVIPSSNSEMAKNLLLLGMYFEDGNLVNQSSQMVKNVKEELLKNPGYYSNWAQAMAMHIHSPFEVAIVGKEWKQKLNLLEKDFIPNAIFMGGETGTLSLLEDKIAGEKTMIYVCRNRVCALPVEKVDEAILQINTFL